MDSRLRGNDSWSQEQQWETEKDSETLKASENVAHQFLQNVTSLNIRKK